MKIMYLTHVNWFWIFQRPQILALLLEKDFDLTVYSKQVLFKPLVSKNNKKPQKLKTVVQLPKSNIFKIFKIINKLIYRNSIKKIFKYDAVWLCHPIQFSDIPTNYKGLVIYDCMDNYVPMVSKEIKEQVKTLERDLVKRADIIFASSNYLQDYVLKDKTSYLVRNGYNCTKSSPPLETGIKKTYTIGYFGTIAEWFDFNLLENSLNIFDNVEYRLVGPNAANYIGKKRLLLEGVVQHSELGAKIKDYDALIMPFVVNDIILAVDPVKLYEYISFGKCVISVWYPEIDRFSPYVYFYRTQEEYMNLLTELIRTGFRPKYNEKQQIEFLKDNSWDARYKTIKNVLNDFKRKS